MALCSGVGTFLELGGPRLTKFSEVLLYTAILVIQILCKVATLSMCSMLLLGGYGSMPPSIYYQFGRHMQLFGNYIEFTVAKGF